jgi:hypothetical protein
MYVVTKTDTVMQRTTSAPKRSGYPFSALLILVLHLGLGYAIYQYAIKPGTQAPSAAETTSIPATTPAVP